MKDKIIYSKCGDYYIPDLTVPDTKKYIIGKYGRLRRQFLKEHHKSFYTALMIDGRLSEHLAEIDEICHNVLKDMVSKMAKQEEVTEQLKADNHMKAKISYVGMQRIERYFVPEEALREALLNALCHKDYSRGIPIQISIYNDKLYIANCGHLPENWTVENLFEKHASQPFNPNIAYVFYLAGFIESWGRGIEKICTVCKNDGVFQPEFTVHPQDIMIKFSAPEDRVVRTSTDRVTEKVTERVTEKVTETENQLLALLMEDPAYTYEALSKKLKVSRKTIGGLIKSLKSKNIICRVGSDTKGYWQITLKN